MDRRKTDRRGNGYADIYVLDIKKILETLWRRRFLLTAFTLIFLIPGVMYVMFKTDYYVASTSVLLEEQKLNLADFQDVLPPGEFDSMTIETQIKVISSPKVIYQTLDALQKAKKETEDAPADENEAKVWRYKKLREFAQNLGVAQQSRSRIVSISYKSTDPYEAAEISNLHAEQYVLHQIESRKEQVSRLNAWIAEQVELLKEDSKVKSQAVQDFRKEAGITLGKDSQDLIYQQISDVSALLVPIETQKLNLQARLEALDSSKTGAITEVTNSGLISNLKTQESSAKQEMTSLGANLGKKHPDYKAAQKRAAQANSDVGRETSSIKTAIKLDLDAITLQENLLRDRLTELNATAANLRSKEITLESLEADELANRTLLDNFLARYQEIKSQLDYTRAGVQIVAPAEVPSEPVGARKALLLIAIAMFSVALAIGVVLLLELLDRGIEYSDDVKKILNLRLVGILPKVKNSLGEIGGKKKSAYLEEIKRAYLALTTKKGPQSILFTSSVTDEGKAATTLALGRYLNSINAKVILVDANTIDPSIAGLAQISGVPGFAEIMAGQQDIIKMIHKDETGLSIIPGGNHAAFTVDLLASDAFSRLVATLKTQYDYVLVDCAPALSSTDAEVLSGLVDQVVLVIEWAKTPKKILKTVAETLRQFAKDIPSAIINKHS